MEYNHRLELLASSLDTTPEQSKALAEEAGHYLKQNKIKGILVADSAEKLAKLIEERNSTSDGMH